jgi:2-oxoglutarate ferredoxin oxidoreductase subunit alpha
MHLNPFPANLGEILAGYDKVLVPELNLGQLAKLLRMDFDVNVVRLNKIKGVHFRAAEIEACILELTDND